MPRYLIVRTFEIDDEAMPERVMLAAALDDELIRTNPAAGIRPAGRQAKRVQPPPPVRVRAVLDARLGTG